jgi:hypothetical protein
MIQKPSKQAFLLDFGEDALEGLKSAVLLEQRQSGHGPVENVIHQATGG